jgi:hypothetical protein
MLTTVCMLGIIISIADFAVPAVLSHLFSSAQWFGFTLFLNLIVLIHLMGVDILHMTAVEADTCGIDIER